MFWGATVYGIVNSVVLILIALGFNLTFGISGIANFGYGSIYVLSGYGAWIMINMLHLPVLISIPLTILCTAILGGIICRVVLLRVRGLEISEVIGTFGIALVILEMLRYFGFIGLNFSLPALVEGSVVIGGVYIDLQRVVIVIIGIVITCGLWVVIRFTRTGHAFRGIAQDERTALCLGIDSDRIAMLSMAFGGGLCAIAAVAIYPIGNISIDGGYEVLIQALGVCIVGGLGSTIGVILAGFMLGMGQTYSSMYLGSHWMIIVMLVAIYAILVTRPSGLLGKQKELEERI